jgi:hypothetical protein
MIIALERLKCHLVEYGRLMDAGAGVPMRAFRRDILRRTADYPIGCQSQALPRRIAGNVCALPNLLDPAHDDQGALLINPSYAREIGRAHRRLCHRRCSTPGAGTSCARRSAVWRSGWAAPAAMRRPTRNAMQNACA